MASCLWWPTFVPRKGQRCSRKKLKLLPVADELQRGPEERGRGIALGPAAAAVRDADWALDQLELGGAQVTVEALHQLGRGRVLDAPEAGQHGARSRVLKSPGEPDHPLAAADLTEPGLAGREHHQIRV